MVYDCITVGYRYKYTFCTGRAFWQKRLTHTTQQARGCIPSKKFAISNRTRCPKPRRGFTYFYLRRWGCRRLQRASQFRWSCLVNYIIKMRVAMNEIEYYLKRKQ